MSYFGQSLQLWHNFHGHKIHVAAVDPLWTDPNPKNNLDTAQLSHQSTYTKSMKDFLKHKVMCEVAVKWQTAI